MKVVNPSHHIRTHISENGMEELANIENAARICYQSEVDAETADSSEDQTKNFIRRLIKNGHESPLEHGVLSVEFTCDRRVANELVRHRLASYSQESTRYCNYSSNKFGNEITVVRPFYFHDDEKTMSIDGNSYGEWLWTKAVKQCECSYINMLKDGYSPQEASCVLPLSLKTDIVVTANYREWRHIFSLRCSPKAHPQMRELMVPLLMELRMRIPVIFDDIEYDLEWYKKYLKNNHVAAEKISQVMQDALGILHAEA